MKLANLAKKQQISNLKNIILYFFNLPDQN
jgi:hypothetical protein